MICLCCGNEVNDIDPDLGICEQCCHEAMYERERVEIDMTEEEEND